MEYNSLRKLPIIVFFEILETDELSLLNLKDTSEENQRKIWNELYSEFLELNHEKESNYIFKIKRKIEVLLSKYKAVVLAIDCLMESDDKDRYSFLKKEGYVITIDNPIEDLEKAKKEANNIIVKVNSLSSQLPKEQDNESVSIYDVLISYCSILGYDIDFDKVSVLKFLSLKKQVKSKIEQIENNVG